MEWPIEYEGIHLVWFSCGLYGHHLYQCGKEDAAIHKQGVQTNTIGRAETGTPVPNNGFPEKYGAWMLVTRRERRNRGVSEVLTPAKWNSVWRLKVPTRVQWTIMQQGLVEVASPGMTPESGNKASCTTLVTAPS
ncbi:PREDICTED: uncharacterized protein LOC109150768 [Ipomoea nil]|uniref:uncharacterized protein LOC109150768 n=1 Tax=Ipomoea nil TaxID=35883 RepID=UPI00090112E7|nr:PREDICTED: uncharacterized protein LOC109150768 [Ipomoea nil]